jgi:hypothetical protein
MIFVARLTTHSVIGYHPASELCTKMINRWKANGQFLIQIHETDVRTPQLASRSGK